MKNTLMIIGAGIRNVFSLIQPRFLIEQKVIQISYN